MKYKLYQVGGSVRDELMGIPTKDLDFTIVVEPDGRTALEVFLELKDVLEKDQHCKVFYTNPEHYTYRTKSYKNHPKWPNMYLDFTLATAGNHIGTLENDIFKRDFTINSLAKDVETGEIIDLVGGMEDITAGKIRSTQFFINQMLVNDPIRILRAYRFEITKNCQIDFLLKSAIRHFEIEEFKKLEHTRVRDELEKWFKVNSKGAMMQMINNLQQDNPQIFNYIFDNFWFRPNIKKEKNDTKV